MMGYELLSEPIRRYIRDKKWESLRAIQAAAIDRIVGTEDNYILASRTASGKTEAAFLPVLSSVNFKEAGVQVLYISPLIALINDQFLRCEDLCRYMDVPVTKWHGEASKGAKNKLIAEPRGVVLITPESIEAMLVNHSGRAKHFFSNLQFIIIDEIHTFLGTDRGIQLQSLLSRIGRLKTGKPVRVIGLSATIGRENYQVAKRFTGNETITKVLVDNTPKEIEAVFKYFSAEADYPPAFIEELYELTKDKKVLIFPNSRGRAEEIAVKLGQMASRRKGHPYYFSHHSSVDKDLREYVEEFIKSNKQYNFCIACTSTLELGIDIGAVDMVVQIDATSSVASLVQRIGRSGRREGAKSHLQLYATDRWELLQSLSCWLLYGAGFIEPVKYIDKPYDLLFHQILSTLKETNGIAQSQLIGQMLSNSAFKLVTKPETERLLQHMIDNDFVEDLKRELITGHEGEKLTNSKDFYAVFSTPVLLKVICAGNVIGEIPNSDSVFEDGNIYLAAKIWKIKVIDLKAGKILVIPANDGKKPVFFGNGGDIHPEVRREMQDIIYNELPVSILDKTAMDVLEELKFDFCMKKLDAKKGERPYIKKEGTTELYTFTGSKINRTIRLLLEMAGVAAEFNEQKSRFVLKNFDTNPDKLCLHLAGFIPALPGYVQQKLIDGSGAFKQSKWAPFLPVEFQEQLILESEYDVAGTGTFLQAVNFITC